MFPPEALAVRPRTARPAGRKAKRVKLRAREHARLQCQNLELDIMNLRQEIATLENLRQLLYTRVLHRPDTSFGVGRYEKIVREFYTLNGDGYRPLYWRTSGECVDVRQFMRSQFDTALAVNSAPASRGGLDAFLAMLAQMSNVLDRPTVEVLEIRVHEGNEHQPAMVTAITRCTSFLTPVVLDKFYPHVQDVAPWLRQKLIGRPLVSIVKGRFMFDVHTGLVIGVELNADHRAGILKLVDSIEEQQILTLESQVVEVVEVVEEEKSHENDVNIREVYHTSQSKMSLRHVLSSDDDTEETEHQHYATVA